MERAVPLSELSLNPLRAFEAAARHLSFTRAAEELCVTQAAVSHQVKVLEEYLGSALFRRTTRGLVLTDEGAALAPTVEDAFLRIEQALGAISGGAPREVLTVGVVGTFAIGFLVERVTKDVVLQHILNSRYKLVVDGFRDIHPLDATTALTRIENCTINDFCSCPFDVHVGSDVCRIFAT